MTWGARKGDTRNRAGDTFAAMTQRIESNCNDLGALHDMVVAPVGTAWARARGQSEAPDLFSSDGRHPSKAGSFLAASVLYATLTKRDPTATAHNAGLRSVDSDVLKRVAGETTQSLR